MWWFLHGQAYIETKEEILDIQMKRCMRYTDILSHWPLKVACDSGRMCHTTSALNQGLNPIKWGEHVHTLKQNQQARKNSNQLLTELIKHRLDIAVYLLWYYIYAFSRHFYPKRLTLHTSYSLTFYQLLLSLGIEPMILALLAPCSTIWATGKLYRYRSAGELVTAH